MSNEEFTRVTYKRKNKKVQITPEALTNQLIHLEINNDFDKEKAIRRILEAKDDIASSDYYSSVKASVREALSLLDNTKTKTTKSQICELVCFGIGHFVECMIARYQFAFILCLHETHHFANIKVCDPALTAAEHAVLSHFGIESINSNIEAKYVATNSTLFYLPHCPKQLSNNLLWANWSLAALSQCIIVANSFESLLESQTTRTLVDNAQYVLKISPYVAEIAIINCFKYFDIFNDSAIHVFPHLNMIPLDFWLDKPEPTYLCDAEYIQSKIAETN